MDAQPVRLRLSRARGFDLQVMSRATNGLPALRVTRPGSFGNPFSITDLKPPGAEMNNGYIAVPTVEDAVACFREMWREPRLSDERRTLLWWLRGHNVACWCAPDASCHADVWLEMLCEDIAEQGTRSASGAGRGSSIALGIAGLGAT